MEKIILETGDPLYTDNSLSVFKGGEFEINDLVEVIRNGDNVPYYQYQANYIKTGEIV